MSSFALKILALISMTIDHIGYIFRPQHYSIYRAIGRLAFPIFAFQTGIGFSKTKNKKKHILGMIIFSIISQYPFYLSLKIASPTETYTLNVGVTLTLRSNSFVLHRKI